MGWLDLWSFASYHLHLRKTEFYRLTPRQYSALMERHIDAERKNELMLAQIVAATVNYSMCRPEKPVTPSSFMVTPFEAAIEQRPKRKRMTRKEIESVADQLRKFMATQKVIEKC